MPLLPVGRADSVAALPPLLATVRGTPDENPEGWRLLREAIGREAIEKAFGPGGGGVDEIRANIARVKPPGDQALEPPAS